MLSPVVSPHATRPAPPAGLALPALDAAALARRAVVPALGAALLGGVLVAGRGPAHTLGDALVRALHADWRWVAAAASFELVSFAGYVALLWLVAGRATPRMRLRASAEVTLAGAAATRLLPTGGAGGAALTLWALSRSGLGTRAASRTLLTFLVLLYAVFLIAIAGAGVALAAGGDEPLVLTALPAALAAAVVAVCLALGLRHRATGAAAPERGRVRAAARLMGEAVHDAITLVSAPDPRLLGAVVWWGFDAAVLGAMLTAFGADVPLLVVVVAYFVGQAANLLPVPGAASGGLAGVLLAFGAGADVAVVAVLGYRAIAIWLPAPLGLAALASLRRTLSRWGVEEARR